MMGLESSVPGPSASFVQEPIGRRTMGLQLGFRLGFRLQTLGETMGLEDAGFV